MIIQFNKKGTRRDFLKSGLRYSLLGGILLAGTYFGLRPSSSQDDKVCFLNLPCNKCSGFKTCKDPLSNEFRTEQKKQMVNITHNKKGPPNVQG